MADTEQGRTAHEAVLLASVLCMQQQLMTDHMSLFKQLEWPFRKADHKKTLSYDNQELHVVASGTPIYSGSKADTQEW